MNREDGSDVSSDAIVVECDLDEPPEKVWRALTVPELLAAWLMPNDIRPEVGGRFTFRAKPDAGGEPVEGGGDIECEVLEVEPNRRLRYSWRGAETERDARGHALDTVVTFVLTRTGTGGTHLRIVHSGFQASPRRPVLAANDASAPAMRRAA